MQEMKKYHLTMFECEIDVMLDALTVYYNKIVNEKYNGRRKISLSYEEDAEKSLIRNLYNEIHVVKHDTKYLEKMS